MGAYQHKSGRWYITCNPRGHDFPRLALPTTATDPATLESLHRLLTDELILGGRRDIAYALKRGTLTLDQLWSALQGDLKAVHRVTTAQLGITGVVLPPPGGGVIITLGELTEQYFTQGRTVSRGKRRRARRLSAATKARYRQSLIVWARFVGRGDVEAGWLTPAHLLWNADLLEKFSQQRRVVADDTAAAPRYVREVSGATINRDHAALSAVRAFGVATFPVVFSPLPEPVVALEREPDEVEHLLTVDEINAILAYCDQRAAEPPYAKLILRQRDWRQLRAILQVLYWTGARVSEVLRMKWYRWHLDSPEPYVLLEGHAEDGEQKDRQLMLAPQVCDELRLWRHELERRGVLTHPNAPVWNGPLAGLKALQKAWADVRTSLPDYPNVRAHRLHDFRHDAAVAWVKSGATIEDVRAALGHKDRNVTYRYAKHQTGSGRHFVERRAAMAATGSADPLQALMLTDAARAAAFLQDLVAAHPQLQAVLEKVVVPRPEATEKP